MRARAWRSSGTIVVVVVAGVVAGALERERDAKAIRNVIDFACPAGAVLCRTRYIIDE